MQDTGGRVFSFSSGLVSVVGLCQPLIPCAVMSCRRTRFMTVTLLISALVGGSSGHASEPADATTFAFDFNRGAQGFVAGFADYPPGDAEIYELTSGHRTLPPPLESQSGLFLSGVNRSGDLFMFFKGPISGLQGGALHAVTVSVEFATNTPSGCVGVGGSPGESVWIKAGVTTVEPLPVRDGSYLRMNIDVGRQSGSGAQAVVLGNIANSRICEQPLQWELKSLQGSMPSPISIPADGRVWLLFGTDSGFESRTEIYFTRATVTFKPMDAGKSVICAENYVTARAVRTREEIPPFVQCAYEFVLQAGFEEARRAFHEDERWRSGSIYVFVDENTPNTNLSRAFVYPPDPSREGVPWGLSIDAFGNDLFLDAHRIVRDFGEGWIYNSFHNPTSERDEPKVSYIKGIEWGGVPAFIGAGIYLRDIPGTCESDEVNAMDLEADPSDERLREFVRCAAMELESKGYFATIPLATDPRWKHGSIYLFGLDTNGSALFSGDPDSGQPGGGASELNDMMDGPFGGRDVVSVGDAFGETLLYYTARNPGNGEMQRKVTFVKRVVAHGLPILVGAGYYPGYVPRPDYGIFPF